LLETFIKENFEDKSKELIRVNKRFKEEEKTFKEKIQNFIHKNVMIKVFISLVAMIIIFFIFWGISIWKDYEINIVWLIGSSGAMLIPIYYGILIIEKIIKKGN